MQVTPVPNIDATPGGDEREDGELEPPLDFGEAYVDYPEYAVLYLSNPGTDDLQIDGVYFEDGSAFYIDDAIFELILEPEEIVEVEVEFDPPEPNQMYEARLTRCIDNLITR